MFVFLVIWFLYNIIFIVLYWYEGVFSLKEVYFYVVMLLVILVGVNFIVNLIVYVIWMLEFRKGVIRMFCRF